MAIATKVLATDETLLAVKNAIVALPNATQTAADNANAAAAAAYEAVDEMQGIVSDVDKNKSAVREYNSLIPTNIVYTAEEWIAETSQSTWAYESKNFELKDAETIYVYFDSITYDGSTAPSSKMRVEFLNSAGTELSYSYVNNSGTEVNVPEGTVAIEYRLYTNNGTASNTKAVCKNLNIIKNGHVPAMALDAESQMAGSTIGEIAGRAGTLDDMQENNFIFRFAELHARGLKTTWAYYAKQYAVPEGTSGIGIEWDSVEYDGGTTPTVIIKAVGYNDSDEEVLSWDCTTNGGTTTIPDDCSVIEFRFQINTTTAANTEAVFRNLICYQNQKIKKITLKDDVKIKSRTVAKVDEILDHIEPVADYAVQSKNLIAEDAFKRGTINAQTGAYGATPQNHNNTATADLIPVKGNTEYVFSWDWNRYYLSAYIFEYESDGTYMERTTVDSYTRRVRYFTFTTQSDTRFIRILFYSDTATDYDTQMVMKHPQLEVGGIPSQWQNITDVSQCVDYDRVKNPNFVIPDYYFTNGYLQGKVNAIRELIFAAEGNYDAFIFITDTHWEDNAQKSTGLIHYLKRALNINKLIHGGDIYSTWSATFHDEMLKEMESAFGSFPYCVVGNHEYKNQMDEPQVWYFLNALHRDIVPGDRNRSYYYFNDEVTKTRYICLNVFGNDGNDAAVQCEADQIEWFQNVALDVETGWKIVILTHAMYNIGGTERRLFAISGVTDEIISAVDNYEGNGEIICILQGHTHIDRMTSTPGGVPIFITTCDKNNLWIDPDTGIGDLDYVDRQSGTINEQAFDVFILDYNRGKISAVRIGSKAFDGEGDNMGTQVEMRQQNMNS